MNKTNKSFFFLFLTIFIFSTLINVASNSVADSVPEYRWETANIDYTWLEVIPQAFRDTSTSDGSGKLRVKAGGVKLDSFTNEGHIKTEGDRAFYRAKAQFSFETTAYTLTQIDSHYPSWNKNNREKIEFLQIRKFQWYDIWTSETVGERIYKYYVEYDDIDFGNTHLKHDYEGNVPLNLDIRQDWKGQDITINGITLKQPHIVSEIKAVYVKSYKIGKVGDYTDKYTDQDVTSAEVSATKITKNTVSITGAHSDEITDAINNAKLGWTLGATKSGITDQQYIVDPLEKGSFLPRASKNSNVFNWNIELQPGVTHDTQDLTIKKADIWWDYEWTINSWSGWGFDEDPNTYYPPDRVIGIHVDNRYIHQEFFVDVNFIADAVMVPQSGGVDMEDDPYVESGDWVWNPDVGGTGDVDLYYDNFWEAILDTALFSITIIVIVVIVIIAIVGLIYVAGKFGSVALLKSLFKK